MPWAEKAIIGKFKTDVKEQVDATAKYSSTLFYTCFLFSYVVIL